MKPLYFCATLTKPMHQVTLKFKSLQSLGDCLYQLGIKLPVIDYYHYTVKADLTEAQIAQAIKCGAEVLQDTSETILPE